MIKWSSGSVCSRLSSSSLSNRVQLTIAYLQAVKSAFGADVNRAPLIKLYGAAPKKREGGDPDIEHVSTSYVERQNLTTRLKIAPALATDISDTLWSLEDGVAKIDKLAPAPKPRGHLQDAGE